MAAVVDLGIISITFGNESLEVSSAILTMSSPVFARMLDTKMKEGMERRIDLPGKSKTEFEAFLSFLHPVKGRTAKVTEENVDFLVEWFDQYEIISMKDECESFLLTLPYDVDRLLQAKKFGLHRQYARCLQAVAEDFEAMELEKVAKADPDVMVELVPLIKAAVARMRRDVAAEAHEDQRKRIRRIEREVASVPNRIYYDLPEQRVDLGGETVQIDEYARDLVAAALNGTLGRAPYYGPHMEAQDPRDLASPARGGGRGASRRWWCCRRAWHAKWD